MAAKYSVSLDKFIKGNSLEILYLPKSAEDLYITCSDVNRPGLILASNDDYFDPDRIQFVGLAELAYLKNLRDEDRWESVDRLMSKRPCVVLITRNFDCPPEFESKAKEYEVPLLRTAEMTSSFMSSVISYLNVELAPRITRHGVLVEVAGVGVFITGDSGVGKSETAVELLKRGHRLVADDAVEIRKVSNNRLVGSAPNNIRHFMELRGIGIVNARNIFGMGAVKLNENINMIVQMEPWDNGKNYDRMGMDDDFVSILDVKIPTLVIPVKPGRNLAVIIEIAALNYRQKKMGFNAAKELLHQLGMDDVEPPSHEELNVWHI